jgi:hypothetical protein
MNTAKKPENMGGSSNTSRSRAPETQNLRLVESSRDDISMVLSEEDKKEAIEGFLDCLRQELYFEASEIKNKFRDIDFSALKGYERLVRRGFMSRIRHFEMKEVFDVVENFGEGMDFSEEIKKAFIFLLEKGYPMEAMELEENLGDNVDLHSLQGYEEAVEKGTKACRRQKDEEAALLMESNFGKGTVTPLFAEKEQRPKADRGRRAA